MNSSNSVEVATPMDDLLTIVLLSHERPVFLRRALKYYSALPYRLLVLDSSIEPLEPSDRNGARVDYRHMPQYAYWGLQAKLTFGASLVTTPYMVFAADDDFILQQALGDSLAFLEANSDYGLCHGYCLMYMARATSVAYYRRDKKVCEDYSSDSAQERVVDYMGQYIPPFYAVTRTALLQDWYRVQPENTLFEWQEIGHVFYMLACAKARILPIPYVVREANYGRSDHGTEVYHKLAPNDAATVAERQAFAEFLATLPTGIRGLDRAQIVQLALDSFAAMADALLNGRSLTSELIFSSIWTDPLAEPKRRFGPLQYVEMPFYTQAFFDQLARFEFMLHAMPAGRLQLEELEGAWAKQEELLRSHLDDTDKAVAIRLWEALDCSAFNRRVVKALAAHLEKMGAHDDAQQYFAWARRLDALTTEDNRSLFESMPSGRLLNWLEKRRPDADQAQSISQYLAANQGGPQFCLALLDLDNKPELLQITFDSLLDGHSRAFKVVVFTTAEPPSATTAQNTLHFVKVSKANYVDKLNQAVRQTACDWVLLAEAGDQFTAAGLLRAGLELQAAPECRAVATDEIQRQPNGALTPVFRPGFNLDLLQSLPSLMARHWLIRRDVLVEAGGYCADFSDALEFDLLLRIIEQGGMTWLAHLDEPVLICNAVELQDNPHERQVLTRHLQHRGYKAQLSSSLPGTWKIDYRHSEQPMVSVILRAEANVEQLQRSLFALVQRTRYSRYEVVIASDVNASGEMRQWLAGLEHEGGRIRVLSDLAQASGAEHRNLAANVARGDYLVLLDADAEVVDPNWIELLLNQAQRPEVGATGAKLIDSAGRITQAGLILGLNDGVGSAFVGDAQDTPGYLHRAVLCQNYSAVSGACMMVRREVFESVGGLDDGPFAEAFSDVDLCLKIGLAGYLTVWTPYVHVVHPGTLPPAPVALAALQEKWAGAFGHDLAYNKNLALSGKGFTLGDATRVNWAQLLA